MLFCYLTFSYIGCKKDTYEYNVLQPSRGDTTTLLGISSGERGDSARNTVYLDLSKEVRTNVLKSSWDLGLYCSNDEFRAIINHSTGATVVATDKTDMGSVTAADTISLVTNRTLDLGAVAGSINTIDPVVGTFATYLAGTAIAPVSATVAENKVYILNRGKSTNLADRAWVKFKITRITNGYQVSYGRIEAASNALSSRQVNKDASYNFKYVSFSSLTANVEPAKSLWDIAYGLSTYRSDETTPIAAPDFMQINFAAGVTAAQVMVTETKTFANYSLADAEGVTFSGNRDVIGVNWRDLSRSTTGGLSVYNDRFYLVKDGDGNIYKLSFAGGGSRGNPTVQYIRLSADINQ